LARVGFRHRRIAIEGIYHVLHALQLMTSMASHTSATYVLDFVEQMRLFRTFMIDRQLARVKPSACR
jgi:hypothetical protein